jgi:hypothetical protein
MVHAHPLTPLDFSIHDPHFDRKMLTWAFQVQCEMHETLLITRQTIAATKLMIAEADRMLARDEAAH